MGDNSITRLTGVTNLQSCLLISVKGTDSDINVVRHAISFYFLDGLADMARNTLSWQYQGSRKTVKRTVCVTVQTQLHITVNIKTPCI